MTEIRKYDPLPALQQAHTSLDLDNQSVKSASQQYQQAYASGAEVAKSYGQLNEIDAHKVQRTMEAIETSPEFAHLSRRGKQLVVAKACGTKVSTPKTLQTYNFRTSEHVKKAEDMAPDQISAFGRLYQETDLSVDQLISMSGLSRGEFYQHVAGDVRRKGNHDYESNVVPFQEWTRTNIPEAGNYGDLENMMEAQVMPIAVGQTGNVFFNSADGGDEPKKSANAGDDEPHPMDEKDVQKRLYDGTGDSAHVAGENGGEEPANGRDEPSLEATLAGLNGKITAAEAGFYDGSLTFGEYQEAIAGLREESQSLDPLFQIVYGGRFDSALTSARLYQRVAGADASKGDIGREIGEKVVGSKLTEDENPEPVPLGKGGKPEYVAPPTSDESEDGVPELLTDEQLDDVPVDEEAQALLDAAHAQDDAYQVEADANPVYQEAVTALQEAQGAIEERDDEIVRLQNRNQNLREKYNGPGAKARRWGTYALIAAVAGTSGIFGGWGIGGCRDDEDTVSPYGITQEQYDRDIAELEGRLDMASIREDCLTTELDNKHGELCNTIDDLNDTKVALAECEASKEVSDDEKPAVAKEASGVIHLHQYMADEFGIPSDNYEARKSLFNGLGMEPEGEAYRGSLNENLRLYDYVMDPSNHPRVEELLTAFYQGRAPTIVQPAGTENQAVVGPVVAEKPAGAENQAAAGSVVAEKPAGIEEGSAGPVIIEGAPDQGDALTGQELTPVSEDYNQAGPAEEEVDQPPAQTLENKLSKADRQTDWLLGIEMESFAEFMRLDNVEEGRRGKYTAGPNDKQAIEGFGYEDDIDTAGEIARSRATADAICQGNVPDNHGVNGVAYFANLMAERKAESEKMTDETKRIYVDQLTELYSNRLAKRVAAGAYGGNLDNAAFLHGQVTGRTAPVDEDAPKIFRFAHNDQIDLIGTEDSLDDSVKHKKGLFRNFARNTGNRVKGILGIRR